MHKVNMLLSSSVRVSRPRCKNHAMGGGPWRRPNYAGSHAVNSNQLIKKLHLTVLSYQ